MQAENSGMRSVKETEETILTYQKLVYGIALTQLKRKHDADDVFQEVFLTYFSSDAEFTDEEHKKAWLIRTTVNFCRKSNFSSWRLRTVSLNDTDGSEDEFILRTDEETRVFEVLRSLKPRYKTPLYLYYFEDMPVEKIAESLGIKKETVRKQLSRGRQMMKERLECDYFE